MYLDISLKWGRPRSEDFFKHTGEKKQTNLEAEMPAVMPERDVENVAESSSTLAVSFQ